MPSYSLTTTIAAGQSLSSAVDCGQNFVVGIIMPPGWTTAHLSVQVSADNINFYDLFTFDEKTGGTSPTEFKCNVVPNSIVACDHNRMLMGRYIKLRSGTRDQPIPQQAARVFTVRTISNTTTAL